MHRQSSDQQELTTFVPGGAKPSYTDKRHFTYTDEDSLALTQWCQEQSFPPIDAMDDRHLYCYLVSRRGQGSSIQQLQNAASAYAAASSLPSDEEHLAELVDQVMRIGNEFVSILIVSDDSLIGTGLEKVLTEAGFACAVVQSEAAHSYASSIWDYILISSFTPAGMDRHASLEHVPKLVAAMPQASTVSIRLGPSNPVLDLRQAEAGIQFQFSYEDVVRDLARFIDNLRSGSMKPEHQLPTPLAIRQSQGLRLTGSIVEFLEVARTLPPEIWTSNRTQRDLAIKRSVISNIRRTAWEVAGIPAPEYARFASSAARSAPEYPEWSTVRKFVRECWQLIETD